MTAHLEVLGTRIDLTSSETVLDAITAASRSQAQTLLYVNAHTLNLAAADSSFRSLINRADHVLNDGVGVGLAARMRGARFEENLNGSDFTRRILGRAAGLGWRVFLYGAAPGVATTAGDRLRLEIPGLEIAGSLDGYGARSPQDVAAAVRATRADLILVALGQPRQEMWLNQYLDATGCRLGVAVGAFLDFSAGNVSRAPAWVNLAGLEWIYRLLQEPRRLWRRYILGNPIFLWRAWSTRRLERHR